MRWVGRGLAPAGLVIALAGCGVLSAGPATPPAIYDLTAPTEFGALRASGAQFLVPEPSAVRAVDSDRIVVRPGDGELSYLAGAQWSDRLPRLVQLRLVEAFENTRKVRAVGRPGQGLLIDRQVVAELRAFEADLSARRARVTISVKLMNDRDGRVIATQVFEQDAALTSDTAERVVQALDEASDAVLARIVQWVLGRT